MHLLLVGLGPSLSHGRAYSKLQDTPVSIPKLSSVPIQLQMGHLGQDTSSDDHHWPPAQQSSSSYTSMVSTSSGYSLLSNFRSWSVNIWREHPNLTKNYLTASMAVTSVLLDTIHLLSELIHHKQNIPGTHIPLLSLKQSRKSRYTLFMYAPVWYLVSLVRTTCANKTGIILYQNKHSISMALVCLIIW